MKKDLKRLMIIVIIIWDRDVEELGGR